MTDPALGSTWAVGAGLPFEVGRPAVAAAGVVGFVAPAVTVVCYPLCCV